jgi:hypothetical protein
MVQQIDDQDGVDGAGGVGGGLDGVTVGQARERVVDDPAGHPGPEILEAPIQKPTGVEGESGFFDPDHPESTDGAQSIRITRLVEQDEHGNDRERFRLDEPIGYWDREVGGILVPANLATFRTDLMSVPRYFAWLVSPTGVHLPAALLHDGLVLNPGEPRSYIANREIDRVTADRIFRSAMRDLKTTWVLRWLIWTAVATATMVAGPFWRVTRERLAVVATVLAVLVGGTLATIDLVDCREPLPWMASRPVWLELLFGGIGAVVIPAVLSVLWWRRWRAGVIAGVALALLVHVTLAIVVVFAVFSTIDAVVERQPVPTLKWALTAAIPTTGIVLIGLWAC